MKPNKKVKYIRKHKTEFVVDNIKHRMELVACQWITHFIGQGHDYKR